MIPRSARRGSLIFVLFVILVVTILLHRSRLLFGLLFEDGSRDAIYPAEYLLDNLNGTQLLIPKIIHQTYRDEDIPKHWIAGQQAVKDLHADYEYIFWTDSSCHDFIAINYASFLPTYESYAHPIQRADAVRYFLLYHYGGIYLDLDISPYRPLTPLLQYPSFACLTAPTGISNDVLGSVPHHPFYKQVIDSLETYDRNWLVSYITIMYSTGPLFLSVMWIEFLHGLGRKGEEMDRVRVLVRDEKEGDSYGFFNNMQGGSWHGKDVEMIFWMGRHWFVVTVVGFVIGFSVTGILWCVVRKITGLTKAWREGKERERAGYKLVDLA